MLFADLAGFTRFAEERDPVEVTRMLNAYFEVATPPIVRECRREPLDAFVLHGFEAGA